MGERELVSMALFGLTAGLSILIYVFRSSPLMQIGGGLSGNSWGAWFAQEMRSGAGLIRESVVTRMTRVALLLVKYGVFTSLIFYSEKQSIEFWILLWAVLLVLELLRKTTQFHVPGKWENISLKLDSEHFWLIHLILLGTVEIFIGSKAPEGLIALLCFYLVFTGDTTPSLLSSLEDVVSRALVIVAIWSLASSKSMMVSDMAGWLILVSLLVGVLRRTIGILWIKRKFWWIAQFCLMTSLIIKAMVVLSVFPSHRP